jgi:hypothetical protein
LTSIDSKPSNSGFTPRVRELQTLASLLLHQLNNPKPESLDTLRDAYSAYMEDNSPVLTEHCHLSGLAGTIKGLQSLNQRLWDVVQKPDEADLDCVQLLRIWADGIVPRMEVPLVPSFTSPTLSQIPQEPQSPCEVVSGGSKGKQRQIEPPDVPVLDYGNQQIDDTVFANSIPEDEMQSFDPLLYSQSAEATPSAFVDPRQITQNGPPTIYPFTHPYRDSYQAVPPDRHMQGKSSTADSGYGTGDIGNAYQFGYQE